MVFFHDCLSESLSGFGVGDEECLNDSSKSKKAVAFKAIFRDCCKLNWSDVGHEEFMKSTLNSTDGLIKRHKHKHNVNNLRLIKEAKRKRGSKGQVQQVNLKDLSLRFLLNGVNMEQSRLDKILDSYYSCDASNRFLGTFDEEEKKLPANPFRALNDQTETLEKEDAALLHGMVSFLQVSNVPPECNDMDPRGMVFAPTEVSSMWPHQPKQESQEDDLGLIQTELMSTPTTEKDDSAVAIKSAKKNLKARVDVQNSGSAELRSKVGSNVENDDVSDDDDNSTKNPKKKLQNETPSKSRLVIQNFLLVIDLFFVT